MSIVEPPSYEQLALLVVELTGRLDEATTRLDEAAARIVALEAEVAALRARVGKDSSNSSTPPSADPPAVKAKRKAVTSQRVRSKDRKRGGQVGRQGSGLVPTQDPDDQAGRGGGGVLGLWGRPGRARRRYGVNVGAGLGHQAG